MLDQVQEIISKAKQYSRKGFYKRYAGYEVLKSQLECLNMKSPEYQQAVKQLATALKI